MRISDWSSDVCSSGLLYAASVEQACHLLVTLRRPGAEGIRFAFIRSDPAGFVTKRLPLPNLPLPRHGGACPLWAVYRAFQTPEAVVRQLAEFPSSDRFLFIARTVAKGDAAYGQRSEEHTSELQSLMRISSAVFCLK